MTNLFKNSGPYEIAISQYGSTLADLPIRFASQFNAAFGFPIVDVIVGGLVFWYLIERFAKKSPKGVLKMIPIIGKYA